MLYQNTKKTAAHSFKTIILVLIFAMLIIGNTSCTQKVGCKMNDSTLIGGKVGKNGKLSTKRGKSSLFPKKMMKRKKSN